MTNDSNENKTLTPATENSNTWQLNALTEALGDLTLTVSDTLSIGRGSDNDVVLGSKEVSRNHAKLSVLEGKLYIKDLDSSNGTFVNDKRIEGNQSKPLVADDSVGFASFAFKVAQPIPETVDSVSTEQPVETALPVADSLETTDSPSITPAVVESEVEPTTDSKAKDSIEEVVGSVVAEPEGATTEDELTIDAPAEPVVKETIAKDVLSSDTETPAATVAPVVEEPSEARATQAVVDEPTVKETVIEEPIVEEPVVEEPVAEEPVVEPVAPRQSEPVTPSTEGQDKTTETELQREADPEVLRAKQAATGQFSGTANLSQVSDIGTEGNNAMSQALNNPANAGQKEKKPSGGWFIWVFVIIIIIALALWLFNMG